MKLRQIVMLLFLSGGFSSFGQVTYEYDSLRLGKKMLGITDSIDYNSGDLPTTFDGGRSILSKDGLSLDRFSKDYRGFRFQSSSDWWRMQFSALPYIGFSYSFGSNGTQFLNANYVQAFSDSLILNLRYQRRSGAGYIRNTAFTANNLQMQLEWKTKFYSMQFRAAYVSDSSQHAGGLDTLDVELGLEFASVNKSDASSKSKRGEIELNNYFSSNPSNTAKIGLLTKHNYQIYDRHYHENDTLYGIYNAIYIDSFTTYDRFTHATIKNGAGIFYTRNGAYIDGRLAHTYWRVGNLGNTYDTTEIDFNSSINWIKNQFNFSNAFHFNILGGFNALSNNFDVRYDSNKWNLGGSLDFENMAPVTIKRSYFSNTFFYNQSDIKLQQMLRAKATINYKLKVDTTIFHSSFEFLQLNNAYLFNDSAWARSTTGITALQFSAGARLQFGKIHIQPHVIYTVEANNYMPAFQGYLRFYMKSTIFKAKKLLLVLGFDASYTTAFNHRMYTPSMDAYTWYQPLGSTSSLANLHAFTAIEISTFRFFARFENIGSFWNDANQQEVNDYPLAGSRVRVGITWDFFN